MMPPESAPPRATPMPGRAINEDSSRKASRTWPFCKPSARSMPICCPLSTTRHRAEQERAHLPLRMTGVADAERTMLEKKNHNYKKMHLRVLRQHSSSLTADLGCNDVPLPSRVLHRQHPLSDVGTC